MKKLVVLVTAVLLIAGTARFAECSSNFSFSSPPVPTTTIKDGESNLRVGLTYLSMKDDGSLKGTRFDYTGGGADITLGGSINDWFAFYWQTALVDVAGNTNTKITAGTTTTSSTSDTNMFMNNHDFNLLVQPIATNLLRPVLFVGPSFSWSLIYNNTTSKTTGSFTSTSYRSGTDGMIFYGGQAGAVLGIHLWDFEIDPFILSKEQAGVFISNGVSTNIPAFNQLSYGVEARYKPWNLTLSSVIQEAAKSGNSSGVKTTIYQVSWTRSWEKAPR